MQFSPVIREAKFLTIDIAMVGQNVGKQAVSTTNWLGFSKLWWATGKVKQDGPTESSRMKTGGLDHRYLGIKLCQQVM